MERKSKALESGDKIWGVREGGEVLGDLDETLERSHMIEREIR